MRMDMLKAADRMRSTALEDWGPVTLPADGPVAQLRGRAMDGPAGSRFDAGVWECSPGRWRRAVTEAEFCHFTQGRCVFHHDDGRRFEIGAGDAVFFPANTTGLWEVIETVRKTYMTVKP